MAINKIQTRRLVKFDNIGGYSATSYDLATETIIDHEGRVFKNEGYTVKPQEIIWIVSRERIELPMEITAHAVIKTGLCNKGLLALNIGIVDPGWHGHLSTAIINFSAREHYITPGERFLRLSFYEHNRPSHKKPHYQNDREYLEGKKKIAIETFGSTFLDVKGLAREVSVNLIGGMKEKIIFWSAIAAIVLGFGSVFVAVATYLLPWSGMPYQTHFDDLETRVRKLEATAGVANDTPTEQKLK